MRRCAAVYCFPVGPIPMLYLDVDINGETQATVTEERKSSLNVILTVGPNRDGKRPVWMHVGGMSEGSRSHLTWISDRDLSPGDRVGIRLGDGNPVESAPVEVTPEDPEWVEKNSWEAAKRLYFRFRDKYETD